LDLSSNQIYLPRKKKKYVNFTEKKNRDFIKLLTKTNKTEKEILEKEEILKKKKLDRFKGALGKQNEIIDEIRKEVYGNNDNEVKKLQ